MACGYRPRQLAQEKAGYGSIPLNVDYGTCSSLAGRSPPPYMTSTDCLPCAPVCPAWRSYQVRAVSAMSEKRLCGLRRVPHAQSLPPVPVSGSVLRSARRLQGDAAHVEPGQRVDRPAASRVKLEVQVRSVGNPPVAHASDPPASRDAFPDGHVESLH